MSSGARTVNSTRHVIPRWRPSEDVLSTAEAAHPFVPEIDVVRNEEEFVARRLEHEADQTPGSLMDLLSAAVVLGREDSVVDEAREIVDGETPGAKGVLALAHAVLRGSSEQDLPLDLEFRTRPREVLRLLRRRLRQDPRNALAWVDAALLYTTLGQAEQAARAIDIALDLAPDNRLVLRSAARFFIHMDRWDKAYLLLSRSHRTPQDPWLTSTLISTGLYTGERVPGSRHTQKLVEAVPIEHATELLSSLGTAELTAGADRKAVRLFRRSLEAPTENVLAQAEWASEPTRHLVDVDPNQLAQVAAAFEANARHLDNEGDAEKALEAAERWIRYQPFSAEPIAFASYIASVGLGDFRKAEEITRSLIPRNRRNPYVVNNRAVALANLGLVEDARKEMQRIQSDEIASVYTFVATTGLLAYRTGDIEAGRTLYGRALTIARNRVPPRAQALLALIWAREEVLHAMEPREEIVAEAQRLSRQVNHSFVDLWVRKLNSEIASRRFHTGNATGPGV